MTPSSIIFTFFFVVLFVLSTVVVGSIYFGVFLKLKFEEFKEKRVKEIQSN